MPELSPLGVPVPIDGVPGHRASCESPNPGRIGGGGISPPR